MSATIHRLGQKPEPSLEPMLQLVAHDLNLVNAVILDRMQSDIPLIPELAGHLIAGGGKRMRPMLTLACALLIQAATNLLNDVADHEMGNDGTERNFFRAIFDKLTQTDGPIEVVDDQFSCVTYAPHLASAGPRK